MFSRIILVPRRCVAAGGSLAAHRMSKGNSSNKVVMVRYMSSSTTSASLIDFPSAGNFKTLKVEKSAANNRIAVITLNRPNKKNSFNYTMYGETAAALRKLSSSTEIDVICITGAGDFYSAGNDLANFSQLKNPLAIASHARGVCQEFVDSFIDCERPLIAAVNGPAVGIGATSLGLVDTVFMSEGAYLSTPFTALGQAPEGCSTRTFPQLLGKDLSEQVLVGGKRLTATEAVSSGFAKEMCTRDQVLQKAIAHAAELTVDSSRLKRKIHLNGSQEALLLKEVNRKELDLCEKKWICYDSFSALANFLFSRKMYGPGLLLKIANLTGPLWGQPK